MVAIYRNYISFNGGDSNGHRALLGAGFKLHADLQVINPFKSTPGDSLQEFITAYAITGFRFNSNLELVSNCFPHEGGFQTTDYVSELLNIGTFALTHQDLAVQRESAQLRYRRGLDAVREGRANAAMIDFARAHDLDPVSHEISAQYAGFMMEQATHMWVSDSVDVQREALTLAHRALSVSPTDTQLLAACSRLLDLPDGHELNQTPEYRRLATLFLRYAHDERRTESG